MGLREEGAWVTTPPNFSLTGISHITALSALVRPGTLGWPSTCLLTRAQRHKGQRLWKPGKACQHSYPEGLGQGEAGWCYEQGPYTVVGGTCRKCSSPCVCSPTCRGTPANSHTWWFPGPQMTLPLLASSLLSDLDPAVTMEPGPKALLETQMPVEATAAPSPTGPLPLPLENRPELQRSPPKATAGRAGPSGTSPLLSSPGWCGCQSDARQTPRDVEGTASLGEFHSLSVHAIPSSS